MKNDNTQPQTGAPGATDAERAAWLADKIVAHGDYAKEAAAMLRRWPTLGVALPEPPYCPLCGNTGHAPGCPYAAAGVALPEPPYCPLCGNTGHAPGCPYAAAGVNAPGEGQR